MQTVIVAERELFRLSEELRAAGGDPSGEYPADMYSPENEDAEDLALKLYSLRREVEETVEMLESVRKQSSRNWDKRVLDAFENGATLYPPQFGYGLASGNYATKLVALVDGLYMTCPSPGKEYGQRLKKIAEVSPE